MIGVACTSLAACVAPPPPYARPSAGTPPYWASPLAAPVPGAPAFDLQSARRACNDTYPPKLGNYLPHAQCVNAAVERYALATEPHPDLLRVQENARVVLSEQVDAGTLSVQAGERKMAQADSLIADARRQRDAGNVAAAEQKVAQIGGLLQP
jgi:hypothetical protein